MIQHATETTPRWRPRVPDPQVVRDITRELGVEPLLASFLANRGLTTAAEAAAFLKPSVNDLIDPFQLADMERAAERVAQAVVDHESLLIYGDADVDGLTSTGLLVQFFRMLSIEPLVYVPNRAYDGYSFTDAGVEHILASGARLVISVDNGVSSVEPIGRLADAGVDVIVTDHHMPPEVLPPAFAIVNPKRADCAYPWKGLAGVGVAFKLACAVAARLHRRHQVSDAMRSFLGESLAWVCMGTVSDMMPLRGENRVLVSRGLAALPRASSPGLAALCAVSGIGPGADCRAEDIAFKLAPRLNAATRMGRSDLSVALITSSDRNEADQLAQSLDDMNRARQAAERELLAELKPLIEAVPADEPVLLASEHWNSGLLGLVAGRIARSRGQPAVLISSAQGDPAKGSCRSVPGFDVHAALSACQEHLVTHGGHPAAAGFSLDYDKVPVFREAFLEHWKSQRQTGTNSELPEYEGELMLSALTLKLVRAIDELEPFGKSNPRPVLITGAATIRETRRMGGDGHHLALTVEQSGKIMRAVAFSHGSWADRLPVGLVVDLLYSPKLNNFRGRTTVELELVDVRPTLSSD